jgi:aerotaxis receptor
MLTNWISMKRPDPTLNELTFNLDEMFFSTTDHRGVILDGNDVFRKISKYSREELIGAPHSIIRHPDMPKIVFKALWDTILTGKPICAYVKNLAKDGSYYWVFATVMPVGDEFLSIRMKPTTHLLRIVEGLYKELLRVESTSGIQGSLALLVKTLNSLGFPDYDSFCLAAITAELTSRFQLQSKSHSSIAFIENKISSVNMKYLQEVRDSLYHIFTLTNKLSTQTKSISEKIIKIEEVSKKIEFSALNTIIEADRLGTTGRALAIVAQHISSGAAEAKSLNSNINDLTIKMLGNLGDFRSTQLAIALATLQVEMITCFVTQSITDPNSISEESFKANYSMLTNLIEASLIKSKPVIDSLGDATYQISLVLDDTAQVLMTLDFIQKSGSIESARLEDSNIFSHLFLTIMNLTKESKVLYVEFSSIINDIIKKDVTEMMRHFEILTQTISSLSLK